MKICLIGANPNFLGGVSLFQKNMINFIKSKGIKNEIYWVYSGSKNKNYRKKDINYVQLKTPKLTFLENLVFEFKILSFLNKNEFDIINSHGFTGLWTNFYKKNNNQKIIHTYHGSTYFFYKNHLKRFNLLMKIFLYPILSFPYFIERPPMKKADRIICVSEHVKKELINLYGKRINMEVIRTGVNLKIFKPRNKTKIRKKLRLDQNKIYGLYVGRGGYWTKGLDKVIKLSGEIYKLNKDYRLLIIGADEKKVGHLLNKKFTVLLPPQYREKMPYYYNPVDIFFSMSRYEGGAPTMVTSEAMASGCLIITDKEANQEIIYDERNGLVITDDYGKEAKRINSILNNTNKRNKIIKSSLKTVKELSLDKWEEKYFNFIFNENGSKGDILL